MGCWAGLTCWSAISPVFYTKSHFLLFSADWQQLGRYSREVDDPAGFRFALSVFVLEAQSEGVGASRGGSVECEEPPSEHLIH